MPKITFRLFQLLVLLAAGLAVAANAVVQKIRTGKTPFRFPHPRERGNFAVDIIFWLAVAAWAAIGLLWFFAPPAIHFLLPLAQPPAQAVQWAGFLLGLAGTAYMLGGILSLGMAFRTSIDYREKTRLVTSGCYRFCRNPMALGLLLNGWASALLTQTAISLAVAALLHLTNRLRIHFEEARLRSILGPPYGEYCARVGRFFPRLRGPKRVDLES